MCIVECGVHGDVCYLADVSDVGRGDDLGDVSWLREFMKSKHEFEHGFQDDPKRRYIGGIFSTKSKNEHGFRV